MRECDYDDFAGMLADVFALKGQVLTGGQKAMFFRALSSHSIAEVRAGMDAHVRDPQRGRFVPMPADIIAQIDGLSADDGRPGPEEAWALALMAADEDKTLVWTDEMAAAWAIARPVLDGGDKVGARMAFKEAYARMVDESRRVRRPAQWTASLGFDAGQRDEVLKSAQIAGRLPAPDVPALPAPEAAFEVIAAQAPPDVLTNLRALRDRFAQRWSGPSIDAMERQRTERLKAQTAEKVAQYINEAA